MGIMVNLNCGDCWDSPCTCGPKNYLSPKEINKEIKRLQRMLHDRKEIKEKANEHG